MKTFSPIPPIYGVENIPLFSSFFLSFFFFNFLTKEYHQSFQCAALDLYNSDSRKRSKCLRKYKFHEYIICY